MIPYSGKSPKEISEMKPAEAHAILSGEDEGTHDGVADQPIFYAWSGAKRPTSGYQEGSDRWALSKGGVSVTALDAMHSCSLGSRLV